VVVILLIGLFYYEMFSLRVGVCRVQIVRCALLCRNISTGDASTKLSPQELLDRILRVDHAGEYGAVRIYEGQLAVLGGTKIKPVIQEFMEQEEGHLRTMEDLIRKNNVKKTALLPLWHAAGFVLGASTALLGKEGAMACTVAVESVIGEHYDNQIRVLLSEEDGLEKHKPLIEKISKMRDEEMEHHDSGLEHNAEQAPFYLALTQVIKVGCWGAIWLSERY